VPKSAAKRKRSKREDKKQRYQQDGEGIQLRVRKRMPHVAQEYQQVNHDIAVTLVSGLRPRYKRSVLGAAALRESQEKERKHVDS
jgi:hypothetical protein